MGFAFVGVRSRPIAVGEIMRSVSGYILANRSTDNIATRNVEMREPEVANGPTLTFKSRAYGIRRWGSYELISPVPLADEFDTPNGVFKYQVFVVTGLAKLVILASRKKIAEYALSNILNRTIRPRLVKLNVKIDSIIFS